MFCNVIRLELLGVEGFLRISHPRPYHGRLRVGSARTRSQRRLRLSLHWRHDYLPCLNLNSHILMKSTTTSAKRVAHVEATLHMLRGCHACDRWKCQHTAAREKGAASPIIYNLFVPSSPSLRQTKNDFAFLSSYVPDEQVLYWKGSLSFDIY